MSLTATQLFGAPTETTKTHHTRLSPTCQQIINADFTPSSVKVVIRTCLADVMLYPALSEHECNNTALLPSGLYADMALVVGKYIWQQLHPKTEIPGLSVCENEVTKNLIVDTPQTAPGQHIEIEATVDLAKDPYLVHCLWRSVKPDGAKLQDHAACCVRFEDKSAWQEDWSRQAHFVSAAIANLHSRALVGGSAHKMQRGLVYKIFQSFVGYGPRYHGMSEVVMEGLEASGNIDFQTSSGDYAPPFHLDNMGHISGFVSNGSEVLDDNQVFISHGWGALKILEPDVLLDVAASQKYSQSGKRLRNYVLMQHKPNGILQGDVYVLESGSGAGEHGQERVVAVWESVRFKGIPRRVLDILLPPKKKTVSFENGLPSTIDRLC